MNSGPIPRFFRNELVAKKTGDYGGPGRVVTSFPHDDGTWRYNVAFKIEGGFGEFFHILKEGQLERRQPLDHMSAERAAMMDRIRRDGPGPIMPAPKSSPEVDRRLDAIEGRLAKITEEQANDVKATDTRLDRLSGMIGIVDDLCKRALDRLTETDQHIETVEAAESNWDKHVERRLDGHEQRLNLMGVGMGLMNIASARKGPVRPAGAIKVGWFNIYMPAPNSILAKAGARVGGPYASKEEADENSSSQISLTLTRVACIEFPDVTEGEGL